MTTPAPRWPRIALRAVACGMIAALLVGGVLAVLPGSYQARIGLLALPVGLDPQTSLQAAGVSTSYGEVVSLAMPSIADVATSPSVLDAVRAEVPGAPDPGSLAGAVSVEVVPSSGVARLSVTSDDRETAALLAESLARQVIDADLLAPAGRLRELDEQASVTATGPDLLTAAAAGLGTGVLVALLVAAWLRPFRPRLAVSPAVSEMLLAAGRAPVPVLDGADPALGERARIIVRASARPVRAVPASEGAADAARALGAETSRELVPATGPAREPGVLLVVERSMMRAEAGGDGATVVRALPESEPVLAVVLV